MAQSVKCPSLDFSPGRDLTVWEIKPHIRLCADSAEPTWNSLSPSLSLPLPHLCSLSLKINKLKKKKRILVEKLLNSGSGAESIIWLLVLYQYSFLGFDKCTVVM